MQDDFAKNDTPSMHPPPPRDDGRRVLQAVNPYSGLIRSSAKPIKYAEKSMTPGILRDIVPSIKRGAAWFEKVMQPGAMRLR
jgi:hypothetical protein